MSICKTKQFAEKWRKVFVWKQENSAIYSLGSKKEALGDLGRNEGLSWC
jgi:hypothetical protein